MSSATRRAPHGIDTGGIKPFRPAGGAFGPVWPILAFSLLWCASSLPLATRYLGSGGAALWALGGVVIVVLLFNSGRWRMSRGKLLVPGPSAVFWCVLLGALWLALSVAIAILYPALNVTEPGRGSDRDDALALAADALLHAKHPYREFTYLGNPITPLPGAILLAVPLVALGGASAVAGQWSIWSAVGLIALWRRQFVSGVVRRAVGERAWPLPLLAAVATLAAPVILHDGLTGGDLLANGIYVTLAFAWLSERARGADASIRASALVLPAALLGLTVASRALFLPLLLIAVFWVWGRVGLRAAGVAALASGSVLAVVVLPVYFWDPASFSPLHVTGKATVAGVPWLGGLVAALSGLGAFLAAVVAFRSASPVHCALGATVAVALPPLVRAGVAMAMEGPRTPDELSYLALALPLSLWAIAAADSRG